MFSAAKRRIADRAVDGDAVARLEAPHRRVDVGIERVGDRRAVCIEVAGDDQPLAERRNRRRRACRSSASCRPAPPASRRARRCRNIARSRWLAASTISGERIGVEVRTSAAPRSRRVETVRPFGRPALQACGDRVLGRSGAGDQAGRCRPATAAKAVRGYRFHHDWTHDRPFRSVVDADFGHCHQRAIQHAAGQIDSR